MPDWKHRSPWFDVVTGKILLITSRNERKNDNKSLKPISPWLRTWRIGEASRGPKCNAMLKLGSRHTELPLCTKKKRKEEEVVVEPRPMNWWSYTWQRVCCAFSREWIRDEVSTKGKPYLGRRIERYSTFTIPIPPLIFVFVFTSLKTLGRGAVLSPPNGTDVVRRRVWIRK